MLTLLTRPALDSADQLWSKNSPVAHASRNVARATRGIVTGRGLAVRHPGHSGVTGSLRRGLQRLGVEYRLNPIRIQSAEALGILAGTRTLDWAVSRPRQVPNPRLVVGPNVHVLASESTHAFLSDRVTQILVPSRWVEQHWSSDLPEIAHKLTVWACGIDFDFWRPTASPNQRRPLIYSKVKWPGLESSVARTLQDSGLEFCSLAYGAYSPSRFKALLQESSCVIYLGGSESQGLALLESWAMDIPTFVFDAPYQDIHLSDGRVERLERGRFSPAPYLNPMRGEIWSSQDQLMALVQAVDNFNPRQSALDYFSDEARAAEYAEILKSA